MNPRQPSPIDPVLAQSPYVRALARKLVFDTHLARDVEQETLLAALEHGPRDPGALRGWLAALVRNFAVKAWRSSSRREKREHAAARPESSVPSPSEILAREDRRRELVEQVLALDEPLRAVLVLRFLEELPPRAVARRLALPVETVRSRTRRGLELLRERLDRESGGDRGAWCLAFVRGFGLRVSLPRLAGAFVVSTVGGVVLMSLTQKIAAGAVLLALLTSAVLWQREEHAEPARSPETAAVLAQPAMERVVTAPAPPAAVPVVAAAMRETQLPAPQQALEVATTGSVLLRVAWHDGSPAADVAVLVLSSASEDPRADALDARTGPDGSCRIEGLPPRRAWFELDRWDESQAVDVQAGAEVDRLVTLPPGYDVIGQVTAGGMPVIGAEIWLDAGLFGWGGLRVARTDAEGRYRIRSIADGLCWLGARAPGFAPSIRASVSGGEGGTVEVPLEFDRPGGVFQGRVQDADGLPTPGAQVLVGDQLDRRSFGRGRVAPGAQRALCDANGAFRFEGVEARHQPVLARAPGRAPWTGEVVIEAGVMASQTITLVPGATVRGVVTDGSGEPVASAEVRFGRSLFGDRTSRTDADGNFVLRNMPVGEFELSAEADGLGRASTSLFGVAGTELAWNPVLEGASLHGRLVLNGVDPGQCSVSCESEDPEAPALVSTRPGADGAFAFTGLAGASYRLEVIAVGVGDGAIFSPLAELAGVHPDGDEPVLQLDAARWPSIRLRGRVLDASGAPVAGITLAVRCTSRNTGPLLATGADGTFDFGPYSPGSWGVIVRRPGGTDLKSDVVALSAGQTWDFGDLRLAP